MRSIGIANLSTAALRRPQDARPDYPTHSARRCRRGNRKAGMLQCIGPLCVHVFGHLALIGRGADTGIGLCSDTKAPRFAHS
jgi:hypothetical protein